MRLPRPFPWSLVRRCSGGCRAPDGPVDTRKARGEGRGIGVRSIDRSDHHRVYVTIVENSLISAMILRRNIVAAKNCKFFIRLFSFFFFLTRRFCWLITLTRWQMYNSITRLVSIGIALPSNCSASCILFFCFFFFFFYFFFFFSFTV